MPSREATQQAARGWSRETTGDDPEADAATAPWYYRFEGAERPQDQGRDAQVRARGCRRVDRRVATGDVRLPRGAGGHRAARADRRLPRRAARHDVEEVDVCAASPPLPYADWHQDGAFLGEGISTLNLWLPLSDCGDDAPGPRPAPPPPRPDRRDRQRRRDLPLVGRTGNRRGGGRGSRDTAAAASSRATRCCSTSCSSTGPRRTRR